MTNLEKCQKIIQALKEAGFEATLGGQSTSNVEEIIDQMSDSDFYICLGVESDEPAVVISPYDLSIQFVTEDGNTEVWAQWTRS